MRYINRLFTYLLTYFKKAFDSISHDKLWATMMDMGYPLHLIDLLAKLYKTQVWPTLGSRTAKRTEQNSRQTLERRSD